MTKMKCKVAAMFGLIVCVTAAAATPPRNDAYGDPLPDGTLLRLGTLRWRAYARFLAFTPDGKTLVTGENNPSGSVVRFWEVATGKETSNFHLRGWLSAFALSPDGKTLVVDTGDEENAIRFLSVPDGKVQRRMENLQSYEFGDLCFSSDGKWLAAAGIEGSFYVWNAADGKEILHDSEGGKGFVRLSVLPDGKTLAVVSRSNALPFLTLGVVSQSDTLRLLDIASGKERFKLTQYQKEVSWITSAGFSPDGKKLIWVGEDSHSFALRDASTGVVLLSFRAPKGTVQPVAFSPDGKHIASFDRPSDGELMIGLWDAATGKELWKFMAPRLEDDVVIPVFSPDGKQLVSIGDNDGLLRVWDVEMGKDIALTGEHQSRVCPVAFSPDGRTVLTGCADGIVRLWDAEKGNVARRIKVGGVNDNPNADHIVFSKDRMTAFIPEVDGNAALWDLQSGKRRTVLEVEKYTVWQTVFAPDGKTLASIIGYKGVQFWDAHTGKQTRRIGDGNVEAFAFSPDGKRLVVESESGRSQFSPGVIERSLWDIADAKVIWKGSLPNGEWNDLQFSPSGSMIAGAVDGGVDLWDAATGKELPALRVPKDAPKATWLNCLAFSPDGKIIAAAGRTGVIYLWEVNAAKIKAVLKGHRYKVTALDYSPDGARLISSSLDTTAIIWDLTGVAKPDPPGKVGPCHNRKE